jgi:hypothetical protein
MQRGKKFTAEQNIGQIHALPRVNASFPKQAHDLFCTASLVHQRDLSSPNRGTRILSQELDKDLRRGAVPASGVIVRHDAVAGHPPARVNRVIFLRS